MTSRVPRLCLTGLMMAAAACARPVPQAPEPPARDLVVLAADPDTGEVGRLTVGTTAGQLELATRGASTTVVGGGAPSPPTIMSDEDIQRRFGPALAVQPPAARRFELYFETASDTLTPDSRAQLPEVLATVKNRVAPDVSIIGHTDTTGAAASNVSLGRRRATLIRDLLVQEGLDASLVETGSHGESNLLVQTPDNTAEARNRRVEVIVR